MLAAAVFIACAAASASAQVGPSLHLIAPDALELRNGFVRTVFNLTRGSLDILQGRFLGDGVFTASPNLAGELGVPAATRRGALSVMVEGATSGTSSTSSVDRPTPLTFTVLSNTSASASFSVVLTDSASLISVTLSLGLDTSRRLTVNASAVALTAFRPSLVVLSHAWTPTDAVAWYQKGVRQGMLMRSGFIASTNPWKRLYVMGDGATGCVEALPLSIPTSNATTSYMFGGDTSTTNKYNTRGGMGLTMWGAMAPLDNWVSAFNTGTTVPVSAGASSPMFSIALYPNDYSFPPSEVAVSLPANVITADLRSILTAVHAAAVSPLHSYDFSPEVRAAPCLVIRGNQCYGPDYNFYDPVSEP